MKRKRCGISPKCPTDPGLRAIFSNIWGIESRAVLGAPDIDLRDDWPWAGYGFVYFAAEPNFNIYCLARRTIWKLEVES